MIPTQRGCSEEASWSLRQKAGHPGISRQVENAKRHKLCKRSSQYEGLESGNAPSFNKEKGIRVVKVGSMRTEVCMCICVSPS
jgi:hypothetical protein